MPYIAQFCHYLAYLIVAFFPVFLFQSLHNKNLQLKPLPLSQRLNITYYKHCDNNGKEDCDCKKHYEVIAFFNLKLQILLLTNLES